MFKINPIRQAIFEGFFQRIVAINHDPTGDTNPYFSRVPVFCYASSLQAVNGYVSSFYDVDVPPDNNGGWFLGFHSGGGSANDFEFQFYADTQKETLIRGEIDLTNGTDIDTIPIQFPAHNYTHSGTDEFDFSPTVNFCAWVEYQGEVGAVISTLYTLRNVRIRDNNRYVGTINKSLDITVDEIRVPNFNIRSGDTFPTKITLHWALQQPYRIARAGFSGTGAGGIDLTRKDLQTHTMELNPPDRIMTEGLPSLSCDNYGRLVIGAKTSENITRSWECRAVMHRARSEWYFGEDLRRADNVQAWIKTTIKPDGLDTASVQLALSNRNFMAGHTLQAYKFDARYSLERYNSANSALIMTEPDSLAVGDEVYTYSINTAAKSPIQLSEPPQGQDSAFIINANDNITGQNRSSSSIDLTLDRGLPIYNEYVLKAALGDVDAMNSINFKVGDYPSLITVNKPNLDVNREVKSTTLSGDRATTRSYTTKELNPVRVGDLKPVQNRITKDDGTLGEEPIEEYRSNAVHITNGYVFEPDPAAYSDGQIPQLADYGGDWVTWIER